MEVSWCNNTQFNNYFLLDINWGCCSGAILIKLTYLNRDFYILFSTDFMWSVTYVKYITLYQCHHKFYERQQNNFVRDWIPLWPRNITIPALIVGMHTKDKSSTGGGENTIQWRWNSFFFFIDWNVVTRYYLANWIHGRNTETGPGYCSDVDSPLLSYCSLFLALMDSLYPSKWVHVLHRVHTSL